MSEKMDRKELKQPDEFQVVAGKVMEWLVGHRQVVLGALGAFALVVVVAWGVSAWSNSQEAKAGGLLAEALEIASRPIQGEPGVAPGAEVFGTRDAREQALLGALEKVRAEAPSSNAARTAGAQLGFLKLRMKDAAGAQALLQEFVDKAPKEDALRPVAIESLGAALEAQGKLDEARAAYARLAEAGAPERAAWNQARVLLAQGKPEAKEALEKVAKEYPKEGVGLEAQRRLELAALPPAPPPGAAPSPAAEPAAPAAPAKGVKPPAKGAKAPAKKG